MLFDHLYETITDMVQCKQDTKIQRIDGREFEDFCKNEGPTYNIKDKSHIKGAYRGTC